MNRVMISGKSRCFRAVCIHCFVSLSSTSEVPSTSIRSQRRRKEESSAADRNRLLGFFGFFLVKTESNLCGAKLKLPLTESLSH